MPPHSRIPTLRQLADHIDQLFGELQAQIAEVAAELNIIRVALEAAAARQREMVARAVQEAASSLEGSGHAVEPPPDRTLNPVFDRKGREADWPGGGYCYPLLSTCRCGRQITQLTPASDWTHCD